jgi:hypothetical protein
LTEFINQFLFPTVLFIIYFATANVVIREVKRESLPPTRDREWLQARSLKDLKAIASQLNIVPAGNRSYKSTWIEAIISTELDLTILPLA